MKDFIHDRVSIDYFCQIRNTQTWEVFEREITSIVEVDLWTYLRIDGEHVWYDFKDNNKLLWKDVKKMLFQKERDVLDEFKRRNIFIISFR